MIELIDQSSAEEPYYAIATRALKLVFHWADDRWAHAIILGSRERGRIATRSIESPEASFDPRQVSAPVFQEIQLQRDGEALLALLVGQAEHHHFSATFRVAEDDRGSRIEVDIADRQTRALPAPRSLAMAYAVEFPQADILENSHKLVVWGTREPRGQLVLAAGESVPTSTVVIISEAGPSRCVAQPIAQFDLEAPAQRCRFAWSWESPLSHLNPNGA